MVANQPNKNCKNNMTVKRGGTRKAARGVEYSATPRPRSPSASCGVALALVQNVWDRKTSRYTLVQ